ncbi:MAG TPA: O-antigen ligase family protein, partial [Gammaproteobacteria bacterium]|nr:O-antigen ligase family protein [Gammaproteobacteria bacterium]
ARSVFPYLIGAGSIVAVIGVLAAIAYFLFGPQASLISGGSGTIPKVYSVVHEANLYASLLGALIPLAVEQFRHRTTLFNAALLVLLLVAIGLGVTRGAYVGLLAGLVVYFGLRLIHARPVAALRRAAVVVVLAGTAGLLLPGVVLNADYAGVLGARPTVDGRPGSGGPSGGGSGGQPGPDEEEPRDELATWDYRMQRVNIGLDDFRSSPMIGMGAYSYGQRHVVPSGRPDTIAVLPVAVLHDAGIVGLAALSGFFAMLGLRAWRAARDELLGGPASALIASVAVLLVAYVATNALHFAVTWVIIGCAAGATLAGRDEPQPMPVVEGRGAA